MHDMEISTSFSFSDVGDRCLIIRHFWHLECITHALSTSAMSALAIKKAVALGHALLFFFPIAARLFYLRVLDQNKPA